MKKLLILLLSALSMVAVAQTKSVAVLEPICNDAVIANILKTSLTEALISSEEWQPVETGGQCMLFLEVFPMGDSGFISCKIMDVTSAIMLATANEQSQLQPKKIQNVGKSLAKQLLEKQ